MYGPTFRFLAAIWFMCAPVAAGAAEIKINEDSAIILEGTIVPGDYDKFRKLINENCPSKSWNLLCPSVIYLASPGGNVTEAIKIGRLVRMLRLGIEVPIDDEDANLRQQSIELLKLQNPRLNYLCASACFFIAIAGIERSPYVRGDKPILGIHRPSMTDADLKSLGADQVIASATQVRAIVETYLKEMGVPLKYVDLMFSIPKDQIRWITIEEYQVDFAGVISELDDWLDARCGNSAQLAKQYDELGGQTAEVKAMRSAIGEKFKVRELCRIALKNKMREDAWRTYRGL
jgi:hypothetical protein